MVHGKDRTWSWIAHSTRPYRERPETPGMETGSSPSIQRQEISARICASGSRLKHVWDFRYEADVQGDDQQYRMVVELETEDCKDKDLEDWMSRNLRLDLRCGTGTIGLLEQDEDARMRLNEPVREVHDVRGYEPTWELLEAADDETPIGRKAVVKVICDGPAASQEEDLTVEKESFFVRTEITVFRQVRKDLAPDELKVNEISPRPRNTTDQ